MTSHVPRLHFSFDPLMAEAKRRARQRRALVALALSAVVAAGAVLGFELRSAGAAAPVPANLTVLAVSENFGGGRALFHLSCDPAGGNVANPAAACAAIAAQPSLVTHPKPFYDSGMNQWQITITGRLNRKPVHYSGSLSWTTQAELIKKLGLAAPHGQPLHLERLRRGLVAMGQTHTFAPGVLRPGDVVACRVHGSSQGPPLAMGVPARPAAGTFGAAPGVMRVVLRADGAVTAGCLARDRMPLGKRGRARLPHDWLGTRR